MEPHRPYSITELTNAQPDQFNDGTNVRVVGRVQDHNIVTCVVSLVSAGCRDNPLIIDTRLVEPIEFSTRGASVIIMGEVEKNLEGQMRVKAKIFSKFFGVDENSYWAAVEKQRAYLASRSAVDTAT